jgi:hypothetical protein
MNFNATTFMQPCDLRCVVGVHIQYIIIIIIIMFSLLNTEVRSLPRTCVALHRPADVYFSATFFRAVCAVLREVTMFATGIFKFNSWKRFPTAEERNVFSVSIRK